MEKKYFIIRHENYDDDQECSDITLQDWLLYINSDKELKLDSYPDMRNNLGFCYWISHPAYNQGIRPPLYCENGYIVAQKAGDYTLLKIIEIANILNGKVIDSEQILYTEDSIKSINLKKDFHYNDENALLGELTLELDMYSSFLKLDTFILDTKVLNLNLDDISVTAFKFSTILKDYANPPTLYSVGRMHRIKKGSTMFEFTIKGIEGKNMTLHDRAALNL